MNQQEVDLALKNKAPVTAKGRLGYIVNTTWDGRPVFAESLDTDGIGRVLNFGDVERTTTTLA